MRKFTQFFSNVQKNLLSSHSQWPVSDMQVEFPRLNLPLFDARVRRDADSRRDCGVEIYDILRQKWVALTPEEWVRQHFVHFLVSARAYPAGLMANEVALKLNGTARRADTVVYSRALQPLAVIEYKAPSVELTASVFEQVVRYNSVTGAPYIIVSNGMKHYCAGRKPQGDGYVFVRDIPPYAELCESCR